jgi:hypothetical protein
MRKMKTTYHAESTMIATSSAAAPRRLTQKELLVKRAAILDERPDTKLGLKDKQLFNIARTGNCNIGARDRAGWARTLSMSSTTWSSSRKYRNFWGRETTRKTMAMALPGKNIVRFHKETPTHLSSGNHQERQTPQNTLSF